MASEQGMYRVFQLIRMLNTPPPKTVKQLQEHLGVSNSQVHRDLELLERLGYLVETDEKHRKFLQFQFSRNNQSILDPDELFFLQEHLQQIAADSPQAQAILHKFDRNLSMIPLADALPQLHANRILQLARESIDNRRCIRICGYHSLSSEAVGDRRVEPLELTPDFRYLIAWDIDKDRQSQFKLTRIQDIEFLDQEITPGRIASPMDIFGLTGENWLDVKLKLNKRAHHLLVEEFPLARTFIRRRVDGVFFEGQVRNWQGIGRFVLGLPGEVEVISPVEFQDYLRELSQKWLF